MTDMRTQFIVGKRLYLRPVEEGDLDRYYRWMNDRDVTRTILRHLPMPRGAQEAWVKQRSTEPPTTDFVFAVVLREGDEHIGTVGIHRVDWIDRTASMGWVIGAKEYWRRGYGFEAVMLALHYAFTGLNLRKVTSATLAMNIASNRIHEKCGYREVGRRREQFFRDGAYYDEILFELFAEDFARVWEEQKAYVMPDTSPQA